MGLPAPGPTLPLMLLITLAGCAATPAAPRVAPDEAAPPIGPLATSGLLVAVRPLRMEDWRRSVLSALGTPGGPTASAAAEYVVRMDDGRAISVVQPDPGGLRAGQRVSLLPGRPPLEATRIAAALTTR